MQNCDQISSLLFMLHQHYLNHELIQLLWNRFQTCRDHFVYAPSQWETALHCNMISYWLGAFTKWSLDLLHKSHIAPVPYSRIHVFNRNVQMCAHFCYEMAHCGIFVQCIVRLLQLVHFWDIILDDDISDPFHNPFVSYKSTTFEDTCCSFTLTIIIRSGYNFVQAVAAELSWHVQNWDLIGSLESELKQLNKTLFIICVTSIIGSYLAQVPDRSLMEVGGSIHNQGRS